LKIYQLHFGSVSGHRAKVYFNSGLDTLYFGPVDRFAIFEDGQKWWLDDQAHNFRVIGCGYHEIEFFMTQIAPLYAKDVLSLGFGAQALYYEPKRLLGFITEFPALKDFTLFYSNADHKAMKYGVEPHKYDLFGMANAQFLKIERENPKWKCPKWKMEYVHVYPRSEIKKKEAQDKEEPDRSVWGKPELYATATVQPSSAVPVRTQQTSLHTPWLIITDSDINEILAGANTSTVPANTSPLAVPTPQTTSSAHIPISNFNKHVRHKVKSKNHHAKSRAQPLLLQDLEGEDSDDGIGNHPSTSSYAGQPSCYGGRSTDRW
jgi:hypothetical protein